MGGNKRDKGLKKPHTQTKSFPLQLDSWTKKVRFVCVCTISMDVFQAGNVAATRRRRSRHGWAFCGSSLGQAEPGYPTRGQACQSGCRSGVGVGGAKRGVGRRRLWRGFCNQWGFQFIVLFRALLLLQGLALALPGGFCWRFLKRTSWLSILEHS